METKKYLSFEGLSEYDSLVKTKIDSGDESTLSSAKGYTDTEVAKDRERITAVEEGLETHTHSYNDISDKPFEMVDTVEEIVLYDSYIAGNNGRDIPFNVDLNPYIGKAAVITIDGKTYEGTVDSYGGATFTSSIFITSDKYLVSEITDGYDHKVKLVIQNGVYSIPESVIPESIARKDELSTKADAEHTHDYKNISNKPFEMESVYGEKVTIYNNNVSAMGTEVWEFNFAQSAKTLSFNDDGKKAYLTVGNTYKYEGICVLDGDCLVIDFGDYVIRYYGENYACMLNSTMTNSPFNLQKVNVLLELADVKALTIPENVIPETIARTTYVDTALEGKSDVNHNHDDEYYTESEIDTKIDTINAEFENIRTNVVPSLEQEILDHANDNYLHVDFSSKLKWDTHIETPHAPSDAEANQDAFGSIVVGIEGDDYKHIAYARSESDSFGIIGGDLITFLLGTDKHEDENVNYETLTISVDSDKLDARYDAKGAASTTLDEAKTYTDTKVSGLATSSSVTSSISSHNTSTSAHNDIRTLISDLSTKVNNFLDVDDTTADELSEILAMIKANEGTLESLTSSKVNVSDIVDNLTTSSTTKVLSAKQGVALKALIDALQTAVDGKAAEGHGHAIADVTNLQSTLDAKAAQTALDGHIDDTTKHITSAERTNWNAAKTHADSAHAPSNAQANVIESIKVNGTAQTITSKAVNITVPTKASDIGAAATSHGTHVEYSTAAPVMDGTASAGSASTVARSDHKHPTDTSRASQVALDELAEVVNGKADSVHVHDVATSSANGFMSSTMFTKLNGIEDGATKVIVDTALNATSSNAIANSVVTSNINTLSQAIQTNAGGITTNANSIKALEESIVEITSEEIQALFAS